MKRLKVMSIAMTISMLWTLVAPGMAFANSGDIASSLKEATNQNKISERLNDEFENDEKVTFLVKFSEKADVQKVADEAKTNAKSQGLSAFNTELAQRSSVISELKYTAKTSQADVIKFLEQAMDSGTVDDFHSYYIVNGMAVTATKEIANKLSNFHSVEKILPNETRQLYDVEIDENAEAIQSEIANVEWNVEQVNAPQVWDMGIDGSGIVVASLDTGVQWDHPALMEKYRGYDASTGEVDHTYSFFDPVNGQSSAYDDHGHGTHVTGTMVGSEPDGSNQVGVAPGAEFIGVKIFGAGGSGSDADILAGGEWILAPGGDVSKAPDVVNNSWGGGPGLDEWYRDVVTAWRAAGIFPEFSAGNTTLTNPGGPGSIAVPANYPESFATGATDASNNLASFSLEGPSPYDEIKPEIAAPGVNIRSSVPGSGYEGGWNGTSMAGPAVSGVAALLIEANAGLSVDDLEEILMSTALPLTNGDYPESPNNGFGHGLVDAYNAVSAVMDGLGTIEGTVTMDGEDTEAPTFNHEAPEQAFSEMDLDLLIEASDNISVTSVEVSYVNANGDENTVEAVRSEGNFKSGLYEATIPGEDVVEGDLTYTVTVDDFGGNTVSEEYTVSIDSGVTVGYTADFESPAIGWQVNGENISWEQGEPTSGPGDAVSGENVYATNLGGDYNNSENSTLLMPPIDLPEGESYLQFENWYNIESGWDYGNVFISHDMENWESLLELTGTDETWNTVEVDLSDYAGERVYIGFNLDSDSIITREGWYIDDVTLSDSTVGSNATIQPTDPVNIEPKDAERVDPSTIEPLMVDPKVEEFEASNDLNTLPLDAQVSVLESGKSVNTNPADGSYSFVHPAGEFTVLAEAYGFASEEQMVNLEADETVNANFVLEELPSYSVSGTVTSANSGNAIEGATLQLIEDANVEPVETDANGNYDLTAYEGEYTMKVYAQGFHSKEISVNFDENKELNIELEPMFTYPGEEIGYDDGTAENARAFYDAGNKWAVKMSLPEGKDEAIVTDGVFQFHGTDWPNPGGTDFAVEVWDASGSDGLPGEKLIGPIEAEAIRDLDQWTVVDLREYNIQVDGDFYMVYVQTDANPDVPGLATDESSTNAERSYQSVGGTWSQSPADEGNYMIRARVDYAVEDVKLTNPSDGLITNESELTVEGTASPTTTVVIENNGEEVGQVEIDEEGQFSLPIELEEGTNELQAINMVDGEQANETDIVTVTLDTAAPELSIEHPSNGDMLNRETVTVEGNVSDEHLDYVLVNGQEASIEDGTYSKRIMLDEGENNIEVQAYDLAGNMSTETTTVEVDFTAPEINNLTPTEDKSVMKGETVVIEFDSETDLDATFSVLANLVSDTNSLQDTDELPMMETEEGHYVGYWTIPKGLEGQSFTIQVNATDEFGNVTTAEAEGKVNIVKKGKDKDKDNGDGNGKGKGNGKENQ
ncbi:S8 family serine peptidase [Aquisalibacillus elongatus]|uniref:Bacillopeptidase F n=1 Tax=Aquisalibacillus elongatus TaxID=485577 RepID=A0A3N5B4E1_9BACI|nr:S8 family serine peptidase [Aquisalibacillus elongatus]RPF52137.1 bacillopeptidase F [Aquisalibacillus elongatus]